MNLTTTIKKYLFAILICTVTSVMISCNNSEVKEESINYVKGVYLCPMNCKNSQSDQPGQCPVCKMDLVKEIEVEEITEKLEHSTESIFKLEAKWLDQNNEEHQLSDYSGKLILTTMIFTRCDYACPNLIGDLQNIVDDLSPKAKEVTSFVLVTMDPDNDTPEKMSEFASDFDLPSTDWHFLTGNKDDIYQYSKLLGIGYKRFENGMYGHSNILSLINESGEIVYQIEGIHANREELVELMNKLAN